MNPPTYSDAKLDDLLKQFLSSGKLPIGVADAGLMPQPWLNIKLGTENELCIRLPAAIEGRYWHQAPPLTGNGLTQATPV